MSILTKRHQGYRFKYSGLNRTLTVYSQAGKPIKTYEGKFDIQETEYGNKIKFELNGKRSIIYNATVIVDQK